ncbi:MAG TPA: DUF2771 family protein [Mycobacteriales bacterium]|jgi:hypothetical protein
MRLKAVLTAAVALLALAGCRQPVPDVTVFTSGRATDLTATTYCFSVDAAAANRCRSTDSPPRAIKVRDEQPVSIDVPSELHHTPWVVVLSIPGTHTAQRSEYQVDKTHLTFTPDFRTSPRILAEVVGYTSNGQAVRPTGLWRFLLVQDAKNRTQSGS